MSLLATPNTVASDSPSGPAPAGAGVSADDVRALAAALRRVHDLGSSSIELEQAAVPSALAAEVSRQPPRLLRDFEFPADASVLELGCRYGAITRLLGERCARVVAVDSDPDRAVLARLRTRDQAHVSVLHSVAGAQELQRCFDVLVCADSAPYAGSDPATLAAHWLAPGGVMIAGVDLEGLEVYERRRWLRAMERVFGRAAFYFPYPDHRRPRCVLRRDFFDAVDLRELVARFSERPVGDDIASADLPAHARSVLLVAGEGAGPAFPQFGVMYGKTRPAAPALEATTRFVRVEGEVRAVKQGLDGQACATVGPLTRRACDDPWIEGWSLQNLLLRRARDRDLDLPAIFRPAAVWLRRLERDARRRGGRKLLPGHYLDATWQNSYLDGDDCRFIDLEWEWHRELPVPVLLIRSLNYFLEDAEALDDLNPRLRSASRLRLIAQIARTLDVDLSRADFSQWVNIDAAFYCVVEGGAPARARFYGNLRLRNRYLWNLASGLRDVAKRWPPSRLSRSSMS